MKTPIQELIENLDTFIGQGMSYSEWKKLTYSGKPSIERYLEKEKEVIMDAYMEGGDWESLPQPRFDNYYNQTFKTKER